MDEKTKQLSVAVESLQNMLVASATGGGADDGEYQKLRNHLLDAVGMKERLPRFLQTCRNLGQFWQFIKHKYPTYAERRGYLWDEFRPAIEFLEQGEVSPAERSISELLKTFDEETVHQC